MTASRLIRASAIATALTCVLATRVFVAFNGVRAKVVETPVRPAAGVARVALVASPRLEALRSPFAVIVRIQNGGASAASFDVTIDGHAVCRVAIPSGAAVRRDCAMATGWVPTSSHDVAVTGTSPVWTLEYVELATHHGGSTGFTDLRLVPAGSTAAVRAAVLWLVLAWFAIAVLALLPPAPPLRRPVAVIYGIVATVIVLALGVMVVLPWVSAYAVVVSAPTFWRWIVLLALPRLWYAAKPVAVRALAPGRRARWVAACALVAALVFAAYLRVAVKRLDDFYGGNYSGFLHISRTFFDGNPLFADREDVRRTLMLSTGGYDGQFMYAAAFDPLLRRFHSDPAQYRRVVDAAPYRYGRIGFSLLTDLFSAGRWPLYPATMLWLILAAEGLSAFLLAVAARQSGLSPLWGAAILLVPGFWQSLQAGLPEPIAAATILGGYLAVRHERWAVAGLLFALSLLVRETGAIFVVAVSVAAFVRGERRAALTLSVLSLAPLVLWRAYVGSTLFSTWGPAAFFFDPHDLGLPFGGFVALWRAIASGQYAAGGPDLVRAGLWYPVLLTLGLALAIVLAVRRPTAPSVSAVVYGVIAVSLNFQAIWIHVGNGQRGTYEMFVMLALASIERDPSPRAFRRAVPIFWALTAAYVFYGAFDAPFLRDALLS